MPDGLFPGDSTFKAHQKIYERKLERLKNKLGGKHITHAQYERERDILQRELAKRMSQWMDRDKAAKKKSSDVKGGRRLAMISDIVKETKAKMRK